MAFNHVECKLHKLHRETIDGVRYYSVPGDEEGELSLLKNVGTNCEIFTPNGDGVNDVFRLFYVLLKLTRPVAVEVQIYNLQGRRMQNLAIGPVASGPQSHIWDGRDAEGRLVLPGLYVWRLCVDTDNGVVERRGVVGVAR